MLQVFPLSQSAASVGGLAEKRPQDRFHVWPRKIILSCQDLGRSLGMACSRKTSKGRKKGSNALYVKNVNTLVLKFKKKRTANLLN